MQEAKTRSLRRDRIRLFGNTISLSADLLIASADTIRMPTDRIRKSAVRNRLFLSSKRQKQGFFSAFWHTTREWVHNSFIF